MKSSKAVAGAQKQVRENANWSMRNFMIFPQALRDAIPGEICRGATGH
jgi:hypothetical protein